MIKHLQITLDNGKTGNDTVKLYILASEGREYYAIHVALEMGNFSCDYADNDYILTGVYDPVWWKETVESCIVYMCEQNLFIATNWMKLTPEMFAEDRWTIRGYDGSVK